MIGAVEHAPEAALEHCRTVTRRRARNFYYGLKLLPEPKRSALYAIYAWMRRADDIADDGAAGGAAERQRRLAEFRARTEATIAGDPPGDEPLWAALAFAVRRFELPADPLRGALEGQNEDLAERRYRTFEELRAYCCRVASTVGLLCIRIWGYDDPRAPELAIDRGIAFQLTNVLRDFAEDYDEGRLYLPQEDFEQHGLEPGELRRWSRPAACGAFIAGQTQRARGFYERSAGLDAMISADCRPTLWAMTSIYEELLNKIARDPARIVSARRIRLHSVAKAAIAMRAVMKR